MRRMRGGRGEGKGNLTKKKWDRCGDRDDGERAAEIHLCQSADFDSSALFLFFFLLLLLLFFFLGTFLAQVVW